MIKQDKQTLRAQARQLRKEAFCEADNDKRTERFLNSEFYRNAEKIFIYLSVDDEADTWDIVKQALEDGKRVFVPYTLAKGRMKAVEIHNTDDLVPDRFGIPAPRSDDGAIHPEELDLVVAPGLLFDTQGFRLGYGGGFYDRFLRSLNPKTPRVGLTGETLIRDVPRESFDENVDVLVTPDRTMNTGAYELRNPKAVDTEDPKAFIATQGKWGMRLGLESVGNLLEELGHPEEDLHYVHIAGTNGKGSMSTMMSRILREAGYRDGTYTSPALMSFNERIQFDQEPIDDETLNRLFAQVREASGRMKAKGLTEPTGFEIETAISLLYFKERQADLCVFEVGLGGRLDATNIIPNPELCMIGSISLEHTQYLGDTVEEIAGEKAGILKPDASVVIYPQKDSVVEVIKNRAGEVGARDIVVPDPNALTQLDDSLDGQILHYQDADTDETFRLALLGEHQIRNTLCVLKGVEALRKRGYQIPDEAVKTALREVRFPGRFEILSREPLILIDGAHNQDGIEKLAKNLRHYFPDRKLTLYFGMLADKNIAGSLDALVGLADQIYTLTPDSREAVDSKDMETLIRERYDVPVQALEDEHEALAIASSAPKDSVQIFTGSLYMIGKIRKAFFEGQENG